MKQSLRTFALITASLLVVVGLGAQSRSHKLFATVTDRAGQPVLDLNATDFRITLGAVTGQVVHASLATEPMRIALLVDTGDKAKASLNHIRNGLRAFLDAIPPEDEVLLMSIGSQGRVRVPPTLDRKKLKSTVEGLFADGGGITLVDALLESWSRFLRNAENRWPVFVILTTDAPENSGARTSEIETFMREIQGAAATAHAITLTSTPPNPNARAFSISDVVTTTTGGKLDALATSVALPVRMKALGEEIAAQQRRTRLQYELDFVSGPVDPEARVMVYVAREGTSVELAAGRRIK